jgi:hypothetical protein
MVCPSSTPAHWQGTVAVETALAMRLATMNRPVGASRCLITFCISSLYFPFFDSSWQLLLLTDELVTYLT